VIVVDETVCDVPTVIVHELVAQVAPAVTVVPAMTPAPVRVMPTARGPTARAVTVSVVPAIEPVKDAE
jgi:hypothetical protein